MAMKQDWSVKKRTLTILNADHHPQEVNENYYYVYFICNLCRLQPSSETKLLDTSKYNLRP